MHPEREMGSQPRPQQGQRPHPGRQSPFPASLPATVQASHPGAPNPGENAGFLSPEFMSNKPLPLGLSPLAGAGARNLSICHVEQE